MARPGTLARALAWSTAAHALVVLSAHYFGEKPTLQREGNEAARLSVEIQPTETPLVRSEAAKFVPSAPPVPGPINRVGSVDDRQEQSSKAADDATATRTKPSLVARSRRFGVASRLRNALERIDVRPSSNSSEHANNAAQREHHHVALASPQVAESHDPMMTPKGSQEVAWAHTATGSAATTSSSDTSRDSAPGAAANQAERFDGPSNRIASMASPGSVAWEQIRNAIQRHVVYPRLGRRMRWQGRVVIGFGVGTKGDVQAVRVVRSSGYAALDNSALAAVSRAAPLPEAGKPLQIELPIVFALR